MLTRLRMAALCTTLSTEKNTCMMKTMLMLCPWCETANSSCYQRSCKLTARCCLTWFLAVNAIAKAADDVTVHFSNITAYPGEKRRLVNKFVVSGYNIIGIIPKARNLCTAPSYNVQNYCSVISYLYNMTVLYILFAKQRLHEVFCLPVVGEVKYYL